MRILVATDAWHPQVNGVVRTLTNMAEAARAFGVEISFLTPQSFRTFAMPSYPDLRLALPYQAKIARLIAEARPDSIHIATEGPIGLLVRRYCRKNQLPFTTSFHTRFPEYISARLPIPEAWIWRALRAFHGPSQAVMAATPALAGELRARGFRNVVLWPRGVDAGQFHPRAADLGLPSPRSEERRVGKECRYRRVTGVQTFALPISANCVRVGFETSCCGRAALTPASFIRAPPTSACRARSSCASAVSRWKRTSRRFWTSICPVPR